VFSLRTQISRSIYNFTHYRIDFVATHGYAFLPSYGYYGSTGDWRHRSEMRKSMPGSGFSGFSTGGSGLAKRQLSGREQSTRRWLGDISYGSGEMAYKRRRIANDDDTIGGVGGGGGGGGGSGSGAGIAALTDADYRAAIFVSAEEALTAAKLECTALCGAPPASVGSATQDIESNPLRWFLTPHDGARLAQFDGEMIFVFVCCCCK
jgi:hypothetical protein